jgi:hypothetical protein
VTPRSGDTLTGYQSADGTHWTTIGTVRLAGPLTDCDVVWEEPGEAAACVIAAITAPDYGRVAAGAGSLCRMEPRSAPVRRQETGLRFGR